MTNQIINCPKCGENIDINQAIYHDLEAKYKAELSQDIQLLQDRENKLKQQEDKFEKQKQQQNQLISEQVATEIELRESAIKAKFESDSKAKDKQIQQELTEKSNQIRQLQSTAIENEKLKREKDELEDKYKLAAEKQVSDAKKNLELKLTSAIKAKFESDSKEKDKQIQQELTEKSNQIRQLQSTAIENEKLKREKDELEDKYKLAAQKQVNKELTLAKTKIIQEQQNKHHLEIEEYKKRLSDQEKLTAEMKRKQEQGSMQLQGEVQELALEQYLKTEFPLDNVEEIKKGQRGADCLQVVNTYEKQNCGTIYYESKRTKDFKKEWITKLKEDMQAKNASLGVLVTQSMPKEMQQAGYKDGMIICSFSEIRSLVGILRQWLIKVRLASIAQENKGKKQDLIYDYLTSVAFKRQLENIVDSYSELKKDIEKEKKQMKSNWKKREKQLELAIDNTIDIYASIKGIAGRVISPIASLEFEDTPQLETVKEE